MKAVSFCLLLMASLFAKGQAFTVAGCSGTLGSNNYGPMYSIATVNATNRTAVIYPASQLASIAGSTLTNIYFNRLTATGSMAGTPNLKIYLKEVAAGDWGSGALTWDISTATLVYDDNPAPIVGTGAGWKNFPLTTNFFYSGTQNLAVFFQYNNATASTALTWIYEYTGPCITTTNSNTTKYSNNTTGTLSATLGSSDYRRPYIGFDFSVAACTNPPTPGTATVTPTTPVCMGSNVSLNVTGNSIGTGQTYQWQSSATAGGTYTSFGSPSTSSILSVNAPATSTYYRCAVTCGGNTQYSTPVQLVVNQPFTGGPYTINSSLATGGTNFQTFAAAVNAIGCGVASPIVFHVTPATYNEQVIIPAIAGASSTNTITFFGHGATLSDNSLATTGERAVIKLNGADFVRIDSFIINTGGGTYGYGVQLLNDADSNTISNCDITVGNLTSTSTTDYAGILINSTPSAITTGGDSKCDGNIIIGNSVSGGYAGIALVANGATNTINANKVLKNIVTDFYLYGIYVNGNTNLLVDSNSVSRPNRGTVGNFDGIYFTGVSTNCIVSRNTLYTPFKGALASTSAAFPIYFNACDATAGNENIVVNNVVHSMLGATGNQNGLLINNSDYLKVYHNTFSLDDAGAAASCACAARGIYVQTTGVVGLDIRNNIISISRGGTGEKQGIYFEPTSVASYTLDNNNYYITGNGTIEIGHIGTTGYTTLAGWQAGSSKEANSKAENPMYTNSTSNLKPLSSVIDNMGTPVGITTDITGASRSGTTPDAGAYEFTNITAGLNMGTDGLVSPAFSATGCYGAAETVTVKIRNSSSVTHNFATNPVTVNIAVTGAVTQNYSVVVNTGTLATSGTLDVSVPTTLNMTAAGLYTFNATTVLAGDVNTSNDAMSPATRTKVAGTAGTVTVSPNSYCITGGMPVLSTTGVTGYSSLQWQSSSLPTSGFVNIGSATTNPYTLTSNVTQTTYYRLMVSCKGNPEDSSIVTLAYNNPSVVGTVPGTRCGDGVVNLSATPSAGHSINWYAAATGGTALFNGNTFTTPSISATTTYYAAASAGSSSFAAGRTNPLGASTGFTGNDYGLVFDATQAFTLVSVDVYATAAAGAMNIELVNGSGTVISTAGPFTIPAGTGTTFAGGATPTTFTLNFLVPPGTGYKLRSASHSTGNIVRDNPIGTNFSYPLPIGSVGNITSGLLGGGVSAATYYYFFNWQVTTGCESGRTAVVATVDCNVPITLLEFKGEKQGAINKLTWTTSTEINNAGFELQRSTDGVNFTKLGFINSKAVNGNSNLPLAYGYNDERPLLGNGYYRLMQMDKDGKSSYSPIVLIKAAKVSSLVIANIYPNPVKGSLGLTVQSPVNDLVTIVVTDITGKALLRRQATLQAGGNNLQLDVMQLAAGSYFVKILCSNGCETPVQKFIK